MSTDLYLPSDGKRRKPFATLDGMGHRQRMRSRILSKGAASLEDYEILEMLLYYAVPRKDTKPIAKALINSFGSFHGVLTADMDAIHRHVPYKEFAYLIVFIQQIALRMVAPDCHNRPYLKRWQDIIHYLSQNKMDHGKRLANPVRILLLNGQQRLISDEVIVHQGNRSIPIIFRKAIEQDATHLILTVYLSNKVTVSRKQKEGMFMSVLQNNTIPFGLNICEYILYDNEQYISILR